MFPSVRQNMRNILISAILMLSLTSPHSALPRAFDIPQRLINSNLDDTFDNNIIDFDDEYTVKYNKKYDVLPWHTRDALRKNSYRYTVVNNKVNDSTKNKYENETKTEKNNIQHSITTIKIIDITTDTSEFSVIPLELVSTTENTAISVIESTTETDLTVIPLSTTSRSVPNIVIKQTVTLPPSTPASEDVTPTTENDEITMNASTVMTTHNSHIEITTKNNINNIAISDVMFAESARSLNNTKPEFNDSVKNETYFKNFTTEESDLSILTNEDFIITTTEVSQTINDTINDTDRFAESTESSEEEIPVFTELDTDEKEEVPEDYYDSKDIVPTSAPKTDALSVIFGFAGSVVESVVESVAERVVPNWIYDIYKRMQKQSEALEAERLRSREENGGLGQFGRGILKSLSTGIGKPLSQLMAGVRDIGSLDSDRGFINSLASGVTSVADVANSVLDAFKDRVQAIYPGTVWCGDGHSTTARSGDLGLFFFTDTCCRRHDACKIFIKAGETKYGLTNTGLFTRSHCSCDEQFRECLHKTNSLVSAQIGLTYFNVLGPQCFRRAHPIVRCMRRTRITGQKCEEYELDYTKPKIWQWFDTETF